MKRSLHVDHEAPRSHASDKSNQINKRPKARAHLEPEFDPPALNADAMWQGKLAVCQVLGVYCTVCRTIGTTLCVTVCMYLNC
jgi:hypothetical protein